GQGGLRAPRRGSRGARAPLTDEMLLDEARVHPAARELDVPEDLGVEGNRRGDALDPELVEGSPHARDRLVAGAAVDDELRDHRVVVRGNHVARVAVAVDANAHAPRRAEIDEAPGRRAEAVGRVFRVDPALDRPASELDIVLPVAEGFAGGDPDLLLDEVDSRDELGDGVLDLDPRVDLDEVEAVLGVDEELDRPRVRVGRGPCDPLRGLAHLLPHVWRETGRWRLLDELLVAALEAA